LIATGSKSANLNIQGIENAFASIQFLKFESDHLPEKTVFMGSRYISFEFAHIAIRSGCEDITILHRGKQPLEHFDPDLIKQLVQRSQKIGTDIRLQTAVKRIDFLMTESWLYIISVL
jgi:glutathione reductase (NADPH)